MARASKKSNKLLRRLVIIAVLVVLILTVRLVEDIGFDRHPDDRFTIVRILDGDTVELLGGDRLRLLSIDTPEKDEPFYEEAKSLVGDLGLNRVAKIEYTSARRDRYGRLLGYLYIDSLFVNKAILENGLGYLYLFKDEDLRRPETSQLLAAQRRAMDRKIGVWSLPRRSEEYYIAKSGSFRLHRPGCSSVAELKEGTYRRFKTREEGLREGLSPCRNCKP
ncbi:MAG: thermonuclease family protein [Candidatus Zixiibacteriota bacterium]